jgi:hypothetical protein
MPGYHYRLLWLVLCLTLPPLTSVAWAEGLTLEEVVVTARKREESLQEVPLAVTKTSSSIRLSAQAVEVNGGRVRQRTNNRSR